MAESFAGPLLTATGLARRFGSRESPVTALDGVDLTLQPGRLVAVQGRSGSGKTTLLGCIGGLDRPDLGSVVLHRPDGPLDLWAGAGARRRKALAADVGFVFQSFGLLPVLTAAENVGVPLRLARVPARRREARVVELLERVGLGAQALQRPGELSGGQQQRVAVARALAASPRLLVADEPTGQLDATTGRTVMALLRGLVDADRLSVVVATHDAVLAGLADEVVRLEDGRRVQ